MNPSEFLDVLNRLLTFVKSSNHRTISSLTERNSIRSVVGAWFQQYRPSFLEMLGEEDPLLPTDSSMQELLRLASTDCSRRVVIRHIREVHTHFTESLLVPLSSAYWSRAPQRTPAGRDEEVVLRLRQLDTLLADSYEQAIVDLENTRRLSYRGPAAELREVLTGILHILAPTTQVQATDWYKESRRTGERKEPTPTRAERTKYILRSRAEGSALTEAAESFMTSVEERLASVVVATYARGSAATHVGTEREEVLQQLQYINALLRELLPPRSDSIQRTDD